MTSNPREEITVCVVGGGTVGPPLTAFLARAGFRVVLLEQSPLPFAGAGLVASVFHSSGCEYPLDLTHQTGRDCVLGGVTARLCLPPQVWTKVAGPDNPVRFLISEQSDKEYDLVNKFETHRGEMCERYRELFTRVGADQGWSDEETARRLNGPPGKFVERIDRQSAYDDVRGIRAGYHAAGAGNDTAAFAAVMDAELRRLNVEVQTNAQVAAVARRTDGRYTVSFLNRASLEADLVVLTASHRNLGLSTAAQSTPVGYPDGYSVFINLAVFVKLQPGVRNGITFTLIEKHGGMFAVIRPPVAGREGLGMLYRPCEGGSQFAAHGVNPGQAAVFDRRIGASLGYAESEGLTRGGQILKDLREKLYPDLKHAHVADVVARTVVSFHARRREVRNGDHPHRYGPGFLGIVGTKWTNSVTAAIEMFHAVEREAVQVRDLPEANMTFRDTPPDEPLDVADRAGSLTGSPIFDLTGSFVTEEAIHNWHTQLGLR